jgi:hypothetical protein
MAGSIDTVVCRIGAFTQVWLLEVGRSYGWRATYSCGSRRSQAPVGGLGDVPGHGIPRLVIDHPSLSSRFPDATDVWFATGSLLASKSLQTSDHRLSIVLLVSMVLNSGKQVSEVVSVCTNP